jgi:hypothetical protein
VQVIRSLSRVAIAQQQPLGKQAQFTHKENASLSVDLIFTCRLKQPCIYFDSDTFAAKKPHKFPQRLASKDNSRNYAVSMKNRLITSKQSLLKI